MSLLPVFLATAVGGLLVRNARIDQHRRAHEPEKREMTRDEKHLSSQPIPQMVRQIHLPIKRYNRLAATQTIDNYWASNDDRWVPIDDPLSGYKNYMDKYAARQKIAYSKPSNTAATYIPYVGSRVHVTGF